MTEINSYKINLNQSLGEPTEISHVSADVFGDCSSE